MRILLYEFVTGGGWPERGSPGRGSPGHRGDVSPPASLLAEGAAMLAALAADLSALDDVRIDVVCDRRFRDSFELPGTVHEVDGAQQEQRSLVNLSAAADWSVIIAPEFCGHLEARCRLVDRSGGRLLGPSARLVALASDKQATAEHLTAHGVRVPPGVALGAHEAWPANVAYPAVLKPRDGAGSQGIEVLAGPPAMCRVATAPARLETFCPGLPASVACLCGPGRIVPLEPCRQHLSDDGRLAYLGGSLPLEPGLAARASRLAVRAIGTLADPLGYLGVDLILGDDLSGDADVVIEINPRLTTSYVGLRELYDGNLAAAMLSIATGHRAELSWKRELLEFEASGRVRFLSSSGGL